MKPFTRLRVRSNTLSEMGDETKMNLMVGYKELINSVNSLTEFDWPLCPEIKNIVPVSPPQNWV